MLEVKIEDGVPAPPPRVQDPAQRLSAELKGLGVGQSVVLEKRRAKALIVYGRYHGWTVRQKREDGENGESLLRVWRVE